MPDGHLSVVEILSQLKNLGIKLRVEKEKLWIDAPRGALSPSLKEELARHKSEFISYLERHEYLKSNDSVSIARIPRDEALCVSFPQERLLFLAQLEPDSAAYNISDSVWFEGRFRPEIFAQALSEIVRRHEILRTTFRETDSRLVQVISPPSTLSLKVKDLRGLSDAELREKAKSIITEEARRPFNLSTGPLYRATLVRLGDEEHFLALTMHHIISDGWSFNVVKGEIHTLYKAFSGCQPSPLDELPIQYADFAHWQRERLQGEFLERQLEYWKDKLGEKLEVLQLPADRLRPPVQTNRGAKQPFELLGGLAEELKGLSIRHGATLFMTLLAAFKVLLYRYTGQENFGVGIPIANRTRPEVEGLIGFFVNTLVLQTDMSGDPSFVEFLCRVRNTAVDAFAHQETPFEKLVEVLNPSRDMSYSPLFQVMFVFRNLPKPAVELSGVKVTSVAIDAGTSMFDLTLYMWEEEKGLFGNFEYSTDLFDAATIERMVGHFETLLKGVVANPNHRISELPLLPESEKQQLLMGWNTTEEVYPKDKALAQLFEEQAKQTPDAVAVVCKDVILTYGELNKKVNQVAAYLRTLGVGTDVFVGICLERSIEMVAGLLGVLKAGGAYVPLDPGFPPDRVQFMLEDSGAPILLTQSALSEKLPGYKGKIVCIDSDWDRISTQSDLDPKALSGGDHLAYVIYTSGSTGKPKGVLIPNRAVVNFLYSMRKKPGLTSEDTILSVTTISFDIFGLELFLPLFVGAKVVLAERDDAVDGSRLIKLLNESGASVMQATPSTWRLLLLAGWEGKPDLKILCGGEALPHDLVVPLLDRCKEFWNLYGPTETTIWSAVYRIESKDDPILIGRPIGNTQIYILDRFLQPVPIGVVGELYIGGDGLARGYLNRSELTAEKFIPNPFDRRTNERIYKTGDLARYRADGAIECLGRTDSQVKVRGFRVEPGEIETLLSRHPLVNQSAVVIRPDPLGESRLVAYIVPKDNQRNEVPDLRQYLRKDLPEYMVPSKFSFLEALPMTPNRKINRKALAAIPDQAEDNLAGSYVAANDSLEMQLTKIWESVLGIKSIGIKDNFFEIGGHSLLAARLFSRIDKVMGLNLPLAALFQAPTIESLAKIIRDKKWNAGWYSLVPIRPGGSKPPLFFVHGAGGNVLLYRDLASHLGDDQPFYGLQSQGLDGQRPYFTRFEDMAALYVKEIRSLQPDGPYFLGGYCLGGELALEMAQQLFAQNQKVALLAMVETYNWRSKINLNTKAPNLYYGFSRFLHGLQNWMFHWNNLWLLNHQDKMIFLAKKIRVSLERMKLRLAIASKPVARMMRFSIGEKLPHVNLTIINDQASLKYSPKPYNGKITLFRPKCYFAGCDESDFGWGEVARDGVEVHVLPVNPRGLLVEPFVIKLSKVIKHCIDKNSCN
jgi:amino acid adenylation domain-containing protein